jgi:hypothetical protein
MATFELHLNYGPPPPMGDFDGSTAVDQSDLDHVLLNWGIVDQKELNKVLLTWGHTAGLDGVASVEVPEPSTLRILLVLALVGTTYFVSWNSIRSTRCEQ